MTQMDDQSLVRSVLNGNQQAFTFLIKKYEKLVFHMIQKLVNNEQELEELAQDVFVKVYEKLPGFRFQSKLSTWIATIAYRHTINHLRKNRKMTFKEIEPEEEQRYFVDDSNPEKEYQAQDRKQIIQRHIEMLPAHYRNILYLYHIEEMSYPEIEEVTALPMGTIKNYLFRARKLLKEQLSTFMKTEELL